MELIDSVSNILHKMRPVCKIFCLFSCAYELYYSKELLVAVKLLLLLQHKHEVVPKTALHHHPVHSTWGAGKYPSLRGFTEGLKRKFEVELKILPGRLMSVARKTISSPCRVVILLCTCIKCAIT